MNYIAKMGSFYFRKARAFLFSLLNSCLRSDLRYLTACNISFLLRRDTRIPHPVGIVIGKDVKLGKNVTIMQNVTIGIKKLGEIQGPTIGDNVTIGAGAVIVGDVEIPQDIIVKANSVVSK